MAGGVGDEELGGGGGVAFDEVDDAEDVFPVEVAFVDGFGFDGVGVCQVVAVVEVVGEGGVREDGLVGEVYFGVVAGIAEVCPCVFRVGGGVGFEDRLARHLETVGQGVRGGRPFLGGEVYAEISVRLRGVAFLACPEQQDGEKQGQEAAHTSYLIFLIRRLSTSRTVNLCSR